ncbi:glycosyltransferase family 2 protein [Pedobacter sp. MC2016-15]|uniref:glycosyltransferase family 2 protein n=1 Tax=Pedobacter sp. MC2016-15 TaxID=2994473 RepID=UPI00224552FC|nr:glycosyltransferase family 2 protein [Pedobacter sp. MC2016-15]MCX2478268.1 glycosyltransferase family 2 protein [Pedobacter sp. MC2016-15]
MTIAVLLATFNRREKTLSCLESLFEQALPENVEITVFLTDDNSSDGTRDALREKYPEVNIFKGSGSLFWAGGMRNSWTEALKADPDYYLLLNDDTLLEKDAIIKLLRYYDVYGTEPNAIAIGSTIDHDNEISYGGRLLYNQKKVQNYTAYSETEYVECDLANANIMLVPREIVEQVGILSDRYTHSIADFDYTMKAKKAGFKAVVMPGVLGSCIDDHGNNWKSGKATLKERISYLKSPKGLAYKEYMGFIRHHFPTHVPEAFVKLWMKTLFPVIWDKFKR